MTLGGRYLISGTEIGMIEAYIRAGRPDDIRKLMKAIETNQFIENTTQTIREDVCRYRHAPDIKY